MERITPTNFRQTLQALATSPGTKTTGQSMRPSTQRLVSERELRNLLKSKGLPERFWTASRASLDADVNARLLANESALLFGKPGRGKTWAAAAWFIEMMAQETELTAIGELHPDLGWFWKGQEWTADMLWLNAPRWLLRLRGTFGKGDDFEQRVDVACRCWGLVLDDLGSEKASDWTAETIYIVIAERESANLPTVVTTNMSLADLTAWHPRVASRLAGFTRIAFEGPDRRLSRAGGALPHPQAGE